MIFFFLTHLLASILNSICPTQATEWKSRADKFEEMCCSVIHMFTRLSNTANRTILYDLYPYIWDIKSIICMVKSFVQWLGTYHRTLNCVRVQELKTPLENTHS